MSQLDTRALRNAFGTFMTGVTVVTAHDKNGAPLGFTANSFTSVSLDPPLVLVCLANTSQNYDALVGAVGFAVNILAETQIAISNTFARPSENRFADISWHNGPQGSPVIDDVAAWFDCTLHQTVQAGDHVILIGAVKAFDSTTAPGLGYARGSYVTPSAATDALKHSTGLVVSSIIERDGTVLLVDDGNGGLMLPETNVAPGEGATAALKRLIATTGLTAEPGFIYSVFEDADRKHQHIALLCQSAQGSPLLGSFVKLDADAFAKVSDPAILTMLKRYAAEADLGNFGTYYGNQDSGQVRSHK